MLSLCAMNGADDIYIYIFFSTQRKQLVQKYLNIYYLC